MNFFVISFEDGKTYRQDFYFASGQGSFNSIINDYVKEYEQVDSHAMYAQKKESVQQQDHMKTKFSIMKDLDICI